MKLLFWLIPSLLLFVSANAQKENIISGQVVNAASQQPVAFATVTLLNAKDSSLLKGSLTDTTGIYLFEHTTAGNYLLCISTIGYGKKYSAPFQFINDKSLVMDKLELTPLANTLNGVTVSTSKPLFEQRPGMMVVNVENSILSDGNTALDVLRKSPGVYIDDNGNISIKGKPGTMVLIDDKPTYLSAEQLNTLLKSMPASNLSKIEIMSNPPAKYDAAGSAGIINIRTKKNDRYGFNGSVNGTFKQWQYANFNTGITLNFRNKLMNVYGSYNYNNYTSYVRSVLSRRSFNADTVTSILTQDRRTVVPGQFHSFKAGADFYLGKRNTIGFIFSGLVNNEKNNVTNTGNLSNNQDVPQSTSLSDIGYKNKFNNLTYDVNYKSLLDTSGTSLALAFDYSKYNTGSLEDYNTTYYDLSGAVIGAPTIWNGSQPSLITIKSGKVDFVHPFKNNYNLEAGGKLSQVNSDNNMLFQDYINGEWTLDTGLTNHFKYIENINAIYADITKDFAKGWGVQIGLRGEQTIAKGTQVVDNVSFSKNYFQLFPTLFIKKDFAGQNELSFSYSRRVDRPDYQSLNPFRFYVDPYTYKEGSPDLQPQITNALNLSLTYKGYMNFSLDASRTNGAFADVIKQVGAGNLIVQYKDNLNTLDNIGLSASAPFSPFKWWQTTPFVNIYYNNSSGNYLGTAFSNGEVTPEFSDDNTFTLGKGYSAELNGYYKGPMAFSVFNLGLTADVSAGIKKSFLGKRANIKLSANDIFNTTHTKAIVKFSNLDLVVDHRWNSRSVNLSFSYVFGNTKVRSERHKTGIEDEQHRVKKAEG